MPSTTSHNDNHPLSQKLDPRLGIMPLLRRSDANSRSNVRPATGVPDNRAENSETKQANYFRGKIFSREDIFARRYFRGKIFSREHIYFRVNSIFAKISSRENISNSLKFSRNFPPAKIKCCTVVPAWLEGEATLKKTHDVSVLVWKVVLSREHSESDTTSMSPLRHVTTESAS